MAYSDDIDALNPYYAFSLSSNATDRINTAATTATSVAYTGTALCEDVVNSMLTDGTTDKLLLSDTSGSFYNTAQTRIAVGGWFSPTAIQNPPKHIMILGGTTAIKAILGWGNALLFEAYSSGNYLLQVFGDVDLTANRAYHLMMVFEGNGYANEFRCYLDGVKQLDASPSDRAPDFANLPARTTIAELGNASTSQIGGVTVTTLAPINGQYNEWAFFDGADAVLTDTEIREELFEKGALPDVTITNQAGLDAEADTLGNNVPCDIRVDVAGNIDLTADNRTFDPLASIHVQYTGTGTLNWTNTNGSNASIGSTPNGGTINFLNPSQLTLTNLDNPTEVRVYEQGTRTEVAGQEDVTTGTFTDTISVSAVDIHVVSLTKKIIRFDNLVMDTDKTINVQQFVDRNYRNPA